jgi:hypothetical protein
MSNDTARNWSLERDPEGVAWLTFDKPGSSANVLSSGVLIELDGLLATLEKEPPRALVVSSAKKSGFIAGADIREFTGITDADSGYVLIHRGQQVAWVAGGAARYSPGIWRHGAQRPVGRRARRDGADADGQTGARRQGAALGVGRCTDF